MCFRNSRLGIPAVASHAFLKDFQAKTVEHVFAQFFSVVSPVNRFLIADEVGLGKTLVASGIVERFCEHYRRIGRPFLKVVYVCSNQSIASQNLDRLVSPGTKDAHKAKVGRINGLALREADTDEDAEPPFLRLTALSPNTSFNISRGGGTAEERAAIFMMVRKLPAFENRKEKLSKIFRLDVGEERWKELVAPRRSIPSRIRDEIAVAFAAQLESNAPLYRDLEAICDERYNGADMRSHRRLVGRLRKGLAAICVRYLEPDLIILDEFQRFKELIEDGEDSEIRMITDPLFRESGIKTLLLSATPYKMFTLQDEDEAGDSHFEEFKKVTEFLIPDPAKFAEFQSCWDAYSKALLRLRPGDWSEVRRLKKEVETQLRSVIARTERVSVSDDRNTLLRPYGPARLTILPADIASFIASDSIARELAGMFDHIHSPVEYCKSAAYPFSFLDGYHLSRKLQEAIKRRKVDIVSKLKAVRRQAFLPFEKIKTYSGIDLPNPKLRHLTETMLASNGSELLWIPPALPYYAFSGPFKGNEEYTKTLIFSSWSMVPKMIAAIVSYECERLTTGSSAAQKGSQETRPREYFQTVKERHLRGKDRHPRPRLRLKVEAEEFTSLSQLALAYPCLTLAEAWNPYAETTPSRELESLIEAIAQKVTAALEGLETAGLIADPVRAEDDRWYLILMIMMDRTRFVSNRDSLREKASEFRKTYLQDEEDTGISSRYFGRLFNDLVLARDEASFRSVAVQLELGPAPKDASMVLARLALASPAVCALRTLGISPNSDAGLIPSRFFGAYAFGFAFRRFLNVPEHISVIDMHKQFDVYWKNALHYLACGNFQSMLDEFAATLVDSASLWKKPEGERVEALAGLLRSNLGLRTVSVSAQHFGSLAKDSPAKHMRCHFAVSLNQSMITDKEVARSDSVRDAFNSPFRPFVLATTSIGQEGLDFHLYCRRILHWNLPANPVDFEQREGRINRFKNHAVRQNVARKYRGRFRASNAAEVWPNIFEAAAAAERNGKTDLVPFWHVEPEHVFIERQAPFIPYSKEAVRYPFLLKTLSLYRIALGQPRQEELLRHFLATLGEEGVERLQRDLLINLSPITYSRHPGD
jgi:hypothetical protein